MDDIKSRAQGLNPNAEAKRIEDLIAETGNVYEALTIISKRANEINVNLRKELLAKLEEFAAINDSIEEIEENKEQVEISKFYERLPNPALIATSEFLNGELRYNLPDEEPDEDED
ncbi:MAG: DNA-directed RNA polymerase subunit omega [Bacteroidetes bacterium]|jgi:DNA-directed RNA polymerase subunit K/omega|nr:DNA-directed RNA polymerase subunit omega [Bacteroidota bacterium]